MFGWGALALDGWDAVTAVAQQEIREILGLEAELLDDALRRISARLSGVVEPACDVPYGVVET